MDNQKYKKMLSLSLFINGLSLIFTILNNIIWNNDTVMIICGIIQLLCIPVLAFSLVKMLLIKK